MLTNDDRARVEAAVKSAELHTTGEIYCVLAKESADYREVPLAWAALAALAAPAVLLAAGLQVSVPEVFGTEWTAIQISTVAAQAARATLAGAIVLQAGLFLGVTILASIPPIRRLLTPKGLKRSRVRQRAREQFLSKNLTGTRARTGVLIYVSQYERMAELIADEGVAAKVDPQVWHDAMGHLVAGIKRRKPAEGFERAIALCGEILARHVPADENDNPNELSDSLVELP